MRLTAHQRAELLVVLLGCPALGSAAWTVGLRLAGAALWALWVLVVVVYLVDRLRLGGGQGEPPAPPRAPSRPPAGVDPAQAFLEALGEDVVGRWRS